MILGGRLFSLISNVMSWSLSQHVKLSRILETKVFKDNRANNKLSIAGNSQVLDIKYDTGKNFMTFMTNYLRIFLHLAEQIADSLLGIRLSLSRADIHQAS